MSFWWRGPSQPPPPTPAAVCLPLGLAVPAGVGLSPLVPVHTSLVIKETIHLFHLAIPNRAACEMLDGLFFLFLSYLDLSEDLLTFSSRDQSQPSH